MGLMSELLLQGSLLALFMLLVLALGFGLLALLAPSIALRWQQRSARRISTRRALKWAEWPHRIERYFYRHHRWYGFSLLVLSGFALWVLLTELPASALVRALAGNSTHRLWLDVVISTGHILLVVGLVLALLASLIILLRPSLLKRAEAGSNRWLSSRQAMRRLEQDNQRINNRFERSPRLVGLLVVISSLLLLMLLWPLLHQLLAP